MKELALSIIEKAFKGKFDKGGRPYVEHCKWVSAHCPVWGGGYLNIAALLHDLLEDCPEWNETALRQLFSDDIVDAVVILTKKPSEKYENYIQRIIDSGNSWAIRIKQADLEHNMDLTRIPELTDDDLQRVKKYHQAYRNLHS